jgi:dipeptidyl aminopeptidase/acylaminoacyl peptidase
MKASTSNPVTIDDLIQRTLIEKASISSDGRYVAYLTLKALPIQDRYEAEIRLSRSAAKDESKRISGSCIRPGEVFDADSGSLLGSAGAFVWTDRGHELFYSEKRGDVTTVFRYDPSIQRRTRVFQSEGWIELERDQDDIRLTVHRTATEKRSTGTEPRDLSIRVEEGARFYKPFVYPSYSEQNQVETWIVPETMRSAHKIFSSAEPKKQEPKWVNSRPAIMATPDAEFYSGEHLFDPSGQRMAVVEWIDRNLRNPADVYRSSRILLEPEHRCIAPETADYYSLVGWSENGRDIFYIRRDRERSSLMKVSLDGTSQQLFSEEASFRPLAGPQSDDQGGAFAVLVRNTNLSPDELVRVDLQSGRIGTLYAPNRDFRNKDLPTVRLISVPGTPMYGRLYLPPGGHPGQRYPLVFTGYMSGPGFDASVGELPVLALTSRGLAVFAMNEYGVNVVSSAGDFEFRDQSRRSTPRSYEIHPIAASRGGHHRPKPLRHRGRELRI